MSVTESKTKTERKSSRKPSKEQETALSALLAYFHERRSLNNFHRDRVITFEQIAE
ncbi:hypothetical protein FGAF437_46290 (plasmid) [Escherichia coli]|nr:hypothetical protein FGAF437_46290 [Escherichia coli]